MDYRRPESPAPSEPTGNQGILRQAIVFFAVGLTFVALGGLIWATIDALLILFGALLLGILLHELAVRLSGKTSMPHWLSLSLVILAIVLSVGIGLATSAVRIARQFNELLSALPLSLEGIRESIGKSPLLRSLIPDMPPAQVLLEHLSSLLPGAGLFFTGALGVIANIAVLSIVAIYLAAQPQAYRHGLMMAVPPRSRKRAGEVLDELQATLAQWLLGKAVSMLVVGVVTTVGLALMGMPMALVLGLIAGLLDFIPYVGPILAGVPAVLIASTKSAEMAGYVALLFLAIQAVQGYLLMPMIERRSVSLPPALTISTQVLMGSLFGLVGVALATPLVAVVMVIVTMLYVQDVLDVPASTPSQNGDSDDEPDPAGTDQATAGDDREASPNGPDAVVLHGVETIRR